MARSKYLSLEEAGKLKKIDRFCKEHPFGGDEELFDRLLGAMAKALADTRSPVSDQSGTYHHERNWPGHHYLPR